MKKVILISLRSCHQLILESNIICYFTDWLDIVDVWKHQHLWRQRRRRRRWRKEGRKGRLRFSQIKFFKTRTKFPKSFLIKFNATPLYQIYFFIFLCNHFSFFFKCLSTVRALWEQQNTLSSSFHIRTIVCLFLSFSCTPPLKEFLFMWKKSLEWVHNFVPTNRLN